MGVYHSCVPLRMKPLTLGWYLPLLVCNIPGALQPSESHSAFPPDIPPISEEAHCTSHRAVRLHPLVNRALHAPPKHVEAGSKVMQLKRTEDATWEDLDSKFCGDLLNNLCLSCLSYRGLVMRVCRSSMVSVSKKAKRKRLSNT